ncbi:ABC transporter permease [Asticcacaulis machinosus]|uniref:ABC transporter permease n=1 Tax=Asticcacaulis machinosus TaxID=2984211 RepID=A0ABT5HIS9_9CAUL|nr:ABC transporter permease [Asticcacaulis machinosus]MDC7676142.1 ABC transporter permease [Asticcacaulis machinosus]
MTGLLYSLRGIWLAVVRRWAVYLLMLSGLSMAYAAALIIGLYIHNELTFDRFLPDTERLYIAQAEYGPSGKPLVASDVAPAGVARWMRSDSRNIEAITRLVPVEWPLRSERRFVKERFYWADANFFDLVKLPALHGDLAHALAKPGSIVLTERMARQYFGRADVVGEVLATHDGLPLTVTAVLRNYPANTHLEREIFASGSTSYAMLSILDQRSTYLWPTSYTYFRLKPGVTKAAVTREMSQLSRKYWQGDNNLPVNFRAIPVVKLHFEPQGDGQMRPRGHLNSVRALMVVSVMILALAAINSAGLILAEAREREREMALYAALGATRFKQIGYIMREAALVNLASSVFGLAVVERVLPYVNAQLGVSLVLWASPFAVLTGVMVSVLIMSALCGMYPAMRITRFSQGGAAHKGHEPDNSINWPGWVTAQLALVMVLLIATHTMSRQWHFAMSEAPGFNGDKVLMVRLINSTTVTQQFSEAVRKIDGIELAAESFGVPTTEFARPGWIVEPSGRVISFTRNSVHPDFFKVFHVPILSGRNLSETYLTPEVPREILINAAASKALGFQKPSDAIGQIIDYEADQTFFSSKIVGVVPDLRFSTVYEPSHPMIFDGFAKYFTQINLRLSRDDPQVLNRIDTVWNEAAGGRVPIERQFYRDYLTNQYRDMYQQLRAFTLVSAVAMLQSVLGLTGLCIFLARHQLREMAIRRALGATFQELLILRLKPFLWPAVLSCVIAWPLAGLALSFWLRSFQAHIPVAISSFLLASALVLFVSAITLAIHSAHSIRCTPMRILRQE